MTNEEKEITLYCLKATSSYHFEVCEECVRYPNCDHTMQDDIIESIIKTLEQQPCEDAISRQEAILQIQKYGVGCFDAEEFSPEQCERFVISKLNSLPPVTPKPKTGQWILTDVEGNRVWHCNCSECSKDPQDYIGGSENWWVLKNKLPKYCPNCGCQMINRKE